MTEFKGGSQEDLLLLGDETTSFVGRKRSLMRYGKDGALLLGRSAEDKNYGQWVYLDALSPHVVFVCGSRGSGKSYLLGVMAEELVSKNPTLACVVIDPVGIFWSMRYPNKEEKEVRELVDWGLEPRGIEKTQVFIPEGMKKKVPKETYDKLFSIRPTELTVDDWCLTFGLDRFSQTSLLLEKALEKTREKYKNRFSIDDLINVIMKDKELTSKDRGYKSDTRRAMVSRLEAAKAWAVFSKDGTDLAQVCKEGHVSIIDISFLEENVASLVIGLLARKILNARKLVTRQAAIKKYVPHDVDELLNVEIPPTWLFIDEAHTLIPSGSTKTPASDALIEYVKQGRRPGCSLVFATQQPSAIDTRVLSQLDLLLCHKLVFDEDLRAVMKRMPTLLPKDYEKTRFLKTLPVGIALLGDRSEETSRAFCVRVRPRYSQHEGRETRSIETEGGMTPEQVRELLVRLIQKRLKDFGHLSLAKVEEIVDTMRRRYNADVSTDDILKLLQEQGNKLEEGRLVMPGFETVEVKEETELAAEGYQAIEMTVDEKNARNLAERARKKKTLGMFGEEEKIQSMSLMYEPLFKVSYDLQLGKGRFKPLTVYVDSDYGLYRWKGKIQKDEMGKLALLTEKKMKVLRSLEKPLDKKAIQKKTRLTAQAVSRYLRELVEDGILVEEGGRYRFAKGMSMPRLDRPHFAEVDKKITLGKPQTGHMAESEMDEKKIEKFIKLLGDVKIKKVEKIVKPSWQAVYDSPSGMRVQKFDAF